MVSVFLEGLIVINPIVKFIRGGGEERALT